jgi:hypothetical protein
MFVFSDGAGMRRRVMPFAVRREKMHSKDGLFVVRREKTHGKDALFAVRRGPKRTVINGTFAVRPYKRTSKALFLLFVLVTLPCVFQKTHRKVAIVIYSFCFSLSKIPKNHWNIIYMIIFITDIIYIIIFITGIIYITIIVTNITCR